MENMRNNPEQPRDDSWLDEILGTADPVRRIGPDEHAMSGLTRPEDAALERIVQEVLAEGAGEPVEGEKPEADDPTRKFTPVEEPVPALEPEPKEETVAESAPEPEPEQKPKKRPVRKARPKRKKGYGLFGIPHILATGVWLAIILAIGISVGRILWVYAADVLAFGKPDRQVTILITEEDTIDDIAKKLSDAGLIRYPGMFKTFADFTKKSEKIDPGEYKLNAKLDYSAMINAMREEAPTREVVEIMFREGLTCAQIFQRLEEEGVCTVQELEEYIVSDLPLKDYWFLDGVERDNKYCLEGYLFPDTYKFYTHDSPRRVLEKFLDRFDDIFTPIRRERLEAIREEFAARLRARGYDEDFIRSHQITIREVVIIASFVEKETANYDDECYNISSVIYNRLSNPGAYPFLNIDAAILYALGNPDRQLTNEDLQLDSPYNTYLYTGLTPGPIANPGGDCLNAALNPSDTGYYYYAYDPAARTHHFSTTLQEHEAFLNSLR